MNGEPSNTLTTPKTLVQAVTYFSDLDVAHRFFVNVRWPDGVVCPHCGSTGATYNPTHRRFQCNRSHDRRQFTVKTGTVMEESPMGLDKWAVAFWLEVNAKNSISSYELHRAIGITQKSAWFMLHRVRLAVQTGPISTMGGNGSAGVDADETFVGGLAKNMHRAKRAGLTGTCGTDKAVVMGILDRDVTEVIEGKNKIKRHSKAIASVVPNTQSQTLHTVIYKNVEKGSEVFTDAHRGYFGLSEDFIQGIVDHAQKYVDGKIHTNGLESFWSVFKRRIKGTHVSVEPFHLHAYLDSQVFRFNNRGLKDGGRFTLALQGMTGKRLTYKQLIGSDITKFLPASDDNGAGSDRSTI
jgi:transposase-like protein